MPALSKSDMTKDAGKGPYAGQSRVAIISLKIKDKKPFIIGKSSSGKKVIGKSYNPKTETLIYYTNPTTISTTTRSNIFKDPDFGGGSGSDGGAEDTKLTESLQCFYCAYVFKKKQKIKETNPPTDKELKTVTKGLCYTTKSLEECLEKGPVDWIENKVYIKTANALYAKYGTKFRGTVTFHRAGPGSGGGSKFMGNIYDAKKICQKLDKESGNTQAPGSFSDDKWNPGDIWMTSLTSPETQKPLHDYTSSWGELKNQVQLLADTGKVLGISLKKLRNARVHEYNKKDAVKKLYEYKGFIFGRNGDFFSSNDIYLKTSDNEIQLRTFNETAAWQGEIKGVSAAGGKVGGGNINFYLNEIFDKKIFNNTEAEILSESRGNSAINVMYPLYEKYNKEQDGVNISTLSKEEFANALTEKNSAAFNMSKLMGLKFLDAFLSTRVNKRDEFITKMYLYAASSTEQSSYFVKLSD